MYQQRPPRTAFNQSFRMPKFQRNPNFEPRGRGLHYGHNPNYRGPLPMQSRNEDYWCETCDRGFFSHDMLETHKQQHQKCNIDGCQFVAHPKVIIKHIQMQHSTGIFKKIGNLNNPEDVQKWREERKRRFPTKENVDKKAAEIKEKIERGEKMGLKKNRNFIIGENQKRKYPPRNENDDSKRKKMTYPDNKNSNKNVNKKPKKEVPLPPLEVTRKLKPFAGILDLVMDNENEEEDGDNDDDYQIEDDEVESLPQIKELDASSKTEEPTVCGALSTLMCEYGSSDEENETQDHKNQPPLTEKKKEIQDSKNEACKLNHPDKKSLDITESINNNNSDKLVIVNSTPVVEPKHESDDDAPVEVKVEKPVEKKDYVKGENFEPKNNTAKKNKSKTDYRNKKFNKNSKPKLPSTLLQKLLHREIQQERNIVLQCIRYIVRNNYFDK